jgi:hypothetical protein
LLKTCGSSGGNGASASAARQSSSATGGGTGELHDTAASLMRGRTMIAVHCDYHHDARMLSVWFMLPQPLPPDEDVVRGEIIGDWQRCEGGFLLRLHEWLEGRQPAPKLFESDPSATMH